VYLSENEDGTITILSQGRRLKVNLHPAIDSHDARPGHELILNEGFNVIETDGYEIQGEVVVLKGSSTTSGRWSRSGPTRRRSGSSPNLSAQSGFTLATTSSWTAAATETFRRPRCRGRGPNFFAPTYSI